MPHCKMFIKRCTIAVQRMKGSQIMDDVRGSNDGLTGYFLEDIFIGQTAVYAKTVTEADVVLFAGISGDTNPVHLNDDFANTTQFKGRIAHGILTASFISTVLGTRLPGPGCIYLSQNLKFKAPVRIGDTVQARVTVTEVVTEKRRVLVKTVVSVGDTVVIDGDAMLMVPSRALT
jgi:3-hydroxybutyryl-CoA dehydratase